MKGPVNLQDTFLNQVRKKKIPVTIYLINGFQLRGTLFGFDNFTVILDNGNQQMVYKHAISTITPQIPVEDLFDSGEKAEAKEETS